MTDKKPPADHHDSGPVVPGLGFVLLAACILLSAVTFGPSLYHAIVTYPASVASYVISILLFSAPWVCLGVGNLGTAIMGGITAGASLSYYFDGILPPIVTWMMVQ